MTALLADPVPAPLALALLFACTTLFALAAASFVAERARLRRRYGALAAGAPASPASGTRPGRRRAARLVAEGAADKALRAELVRAGFFDPGAARTYALASRAARVGAPLLGIVLAFTALHGWGAVDRAALVALLAALGHYGPPAFLKRRQRLLREKIRLAFPDFLDMLVVCVNAGLSLEAALDRAARELGRGVGELRANLDLMAAEMRAGKGMGDALQALSDRLGLPEARSFAGLLRQTVELGTDVAQALATFSDEMRHKRLTTAEEKAAALPPKLTLPLGLFIFPVVLMAVLAPAVLRILDVVGR